MGKERDRILNGRKFWDKLKGKLKHRNTSETKDLTTLKTGVYIVLIADIQDALEHRLRTYYRN